ncbi:MAG: hypothetical protein O9256_02995 [Rhizobiaceae bacterium]|nr:hypothetical protein [Rhizobiaceae bacterium]
MIRETGFSVKTVGKTQAALQSPFDEVRDLMAQSKCAIVLGLPFIFVPESVTPKPATAWLVPMASTIAVHRPLGAAALLPRCMGRLS